MALTLIVSPRKPQDRVLNHLKNVRIFLNTNYCKNINFNLIFFTANGKDKSESPKTEELDDSNEETENGKEDEPVEKMDESTGEETETSEIEKTETFNNNRSSRQKIILL